MIREVSVIKATGGNGRIDLVLWQTGECWEIKPSHLYLAGCAQLTNYIRGEVTDKRWNRSRTPRRGGYLPQGTIITDEMIINYWYAGNGVIIMLLQKVNIVCFRYILIDIRETRVIDFLKRGF